MSSAREYDALRESEAAAVLDRPLEELADPWQELRASWGRMQPDDTLTIRYGASGEYRLHSGDVRNLLRLAGFEPGRARKIAGGYQMEGRRVHRENRALTCSVIVPCRNEVGNIDRLVRRVPPLGSHTELVFIDGASTDGTVERIEANIRTHPDRDIVLLHQRDMTGGKGAAVFQAFDEARGDILMILDADMTVAPEDLPRFFLAVAEGVADFANGARLVFPLEPQAMQPANIVGNHVFAWVFSLLLRTRITDTLCGTKVLRREQWPAVRDARPLFGGHDPFGDFDLLFAARYAGLRMIDVPIRYRARTSGLSKIHRWRDGVSLARTCLAALRVFTLPRAR